LGLFKITMKEHQKYIRRAIELAAENIETGGGPFGAVIVKEGKVIAEGVNHVTVHNDPTAHAEVEAIRSAGRILENFDLSGCAIYASCEPCPMCLSAIYWSRISEVYFAGDRVDAEQAGFDDSLIYDEISKPQERRKIRMVQIQDPRVKDLFSRWNSKSDKTPY